VEHSLVSYMLNPLYSAENCRIAWQLRWSLTAFPTNDLPGAVHWREQLSQAIEPDGIRLLETDIETGSAKFFLSTSPAVSPAAIIRSVKGRPQYLLRNSIPKLWRRHYSITSVGDANMQRFKAM